MVTWAREIIFLVSSIIGKKKFSLFYMNLLLYFYLSTSTQSDVAHGGYVAAVHVPPSKDISSAQDHSRSSAHGP